ncbi:hypothetical protein ALSL_0339 [Aerosticca soli]|uniref:Uncharacterized protein n=1 Tax=Aerosticca soli TaxID=2010829 RepID=A0A2Z6E2N7_9GAMM|nr:hypothetical protein ALSL_0339 [Aerosticca soli]
MKARSPQHHVSVRDTKRAGQEKTLMWMSGRPDVQTHIVRNEALDRTR